MRCVYAFAVALVLFAADSVAAQRVMTHVESANFTTAARYLGLAQTSAASGDWKLASDRASRGLSYDDTISDLWYIRAYAESNRGAPPYVVIPYLRSSLEANAWIGYHRDAARLLYARLLSDTREMERALDVLNEAPGISGVEADFIRAQSLYRIGTVDSRAAGRALSQAVLKTTQLGPWKEQFILLLFRWEILPGYDTTSFLRNITADYVADVFESDTRNADLVIMAAAFASGLDRPRLLQWFRATGLSHPLFALFAMDDALISPEEALDYFIGAVDRAGEVDLELLEVFGARLSSYAAANAVEADAAGSEAGTIAGGIADGSSAADENAPPPRNIISEFSSFLGAFKGTLIVDTDRDGIVNLRCEYEAGRPARINYDQNQDGVDSWSIFCDLGAPRDGYFPAAATRIVWGDYPYIGRATVRNDLEYSFGRATLSWTPLAIRFSETLYDSPGVFLFYYPALKADANPLAERLLLGAASWIRAKVTAAPTFRRDESMEVLFTLENGRAVTADYYPWPAQSWGRAGDRVGIYARGFFENGILTRRLVDMDGDGIFEREETYVFDSEKAPRFLSPVDAAALYRELFGSMPFAPGLYCAKIALDEDGDTVADFTEEYLENNGKISRWTGKTANWATAHIRFPEDGGGDINSEVEFRYNTHTLVTVQLKNGVPVSLTRNQKRSPVTAVNDTYWIGVPRDDDMSAVSAVLSSLPKNTVTISTIDRNGGSFRVYLAYIGDYKFAELVDE